MRPPPAGSLRVADTLPTFGQIVETLTFRAGHNTSVVVLGATLLGLAAGVVGVFALLRKRSLVADAVAHATLPGIGIAFLTAGLLGLDGRSLPVLLVGAAVSGTLGVACVHGILRWTRLREDAAIGIVLSVFFGAGVVAMSYIQKNAAAGAAGLNTFIFGQTAAMSTHDATLMAVIATVAILAAALLLKEFSLVCFNDAFARVDGWPVWLIDALMMTLLITVTVAGLQAVGLILVVAMLIVPAVSARFWTDRLWLLVVLAGVMGAASGYLGASVSALLPRKPAGSVIVLTSGVVFAVSLLAAPRRGVLAVFVQRLRMRLRFAGEHLLEAAYDASGRGGSDRARLSREDVRRVAEERGWAWGVRPFVVFALRRGDLVKDGGTPGSIVLTDRGVASGARIARNHRLWEEYLTSYADVAPSHVDWSVDQVEHVLSEELVDELEAQLEARGVDLPGGKTLIWSAGESQGGDA